MGRDEAAEGRGTVHHVPRGAGVVPTAEPVGAGAGEAAGLRASLVILLALQPASEEWGCSLGGGRMLWGSAQPQIQSVLSPSGACLSFAELTVHPEVSPTPHPPAPCCGLSSTMSSHSVLWTQGWGLFFAAWLSGLPGELSSGLWRQLSVFPTALERRPGLAGWTLGLFRVGICLSTSSSPRRGVQTGSFISLAGPSVSASLLAPPPPGVPEYWGVLSTESTEDSPLEDPTDLR